MIGNPTRERGGVSFPKISLANASGCQQFRHCGIEPSFKAVTWTSNTFDPAISTALESHHNQVRNASNRGGLGAGLTRSF